MYERGGGITTMGNREKQRDEDEEEWSEEGNE